MSLLLAGITIACIQSFGLETPSPPPRGADLVQAMTVAKPHDWQREKRKLERKIGDSNSAYDRNDLAVALIHLGDPRRAITILEEIEREEPGRYQTASNLGTAYELAGDDVRALRWIAEGLRRNPTAHIGTEWLHVLILQAKLNVARDPRWLETHSILSMGFGSRLAPNKPYRYPTGNEGKPLDAHMTGNGILYQMRERLQFVKPPEPVVGDILFDYANLLWHSDPESAAAVYELAIRYGAPRSTLAKQRRAHLIAR
jgi:tetratricopeptide (TPR) repeat protein